MRKIEIINSLLTSLDDGAPAVLAIVVETAGSAPRQPGAWMGVFADGRVAGTVGGGALEGRAIEDARALLASGESRLVRYSIGGAKSDTGMVCGGSVELVLMNLASAHRGALEGAAAAIARREEGVLSVDLAPFGGALSVGEHGSDAARSTRGTLSWGVELGVAPSTLVPGLHGGCYVEPLTSEARAFVFGCGHVGRALVEVLGFAGFAVIACDDRPEMLAADLLPRAEERVRVDYGDLAARVNVTSRDFAVVCTSGHASDFEVLVQMLRVRPAYIGCLGSEKKTVHTKKRLMGEGFSAAQVETVQMPVGIPIACETPEEIAISVAAQMVDARRSNRIGRL